MNTRPLASMCVCPELRRNDFTSTKVEPRLNSALLIQAIGR